MNIIMEQTQGIKFHNQNWLALTLFMNKEHNLQNCRGKLRTQDIE
jgi:hypothetical protein